MLSPADQIRLRNQHRQAGAGIPRPIASIPDAELIACLVEHGQPRHAALELRRNPMLREAALRFWVDVGDANRGDKAAKERVDYCRDCWSQMRAAELISDDPRRGVPVEQLVNPDDLVA